MSAQKFECISMETNSETKELLSMAAFLSGHKDLSSFILDTMQKEAQKIFDDKNKLVLSNRDRDLVLDLIDNPPEPNQKLIDILQKSSSNFSDLKFNPLLAKDEAR